MLEDDWAPASAGGTAPPRVLMSGRLVEKKGFADGVAAFAEARRAGLEARLTIMGSGPEEERIRAAVRRHGLDGEVELLPPLPRREFRQSLRSCQVFLQPSRTASDGDSEGTPATILDAQSLGRIVVTTAHSDIPAIVDPAAAFLAPEGDVDALAASLAEALTRTDDWPARGAAGRRFVEANHSPERVASLLGRLYDEVAPSRETR
jgi:colanic acid/amylovoran biosynthesis glycosyltransferase